MSSKANGSSLAPSYNPVCQHIVSRGGGGWAKVGEARACSNLLQARGAQSCGAAPEISGATDMCEAGNTVITGYSITTDYAQSPCSDVVVAVDWVINNCALCPSDDCLVGGLYQNIHGS